MNDSNCEELGCSCDMDYEPAADYEVVRRTIDTTMALEDAGYRIEDIGNGILNVYNRESGLYLWTVTVTIST